MIQEIQHKETGDVLFSGESSLCACLEAAVRVNANLSGADLSGADLSSANLRWANLSGANLNGADLLDTNLLDTNLTDTNLVGVIERTTKNQAATEEIVIQFHGYVLDLFVTDAGSLGLTIERAPTHKGNPSVDVFVTPDLKVTHC